MEKQEQIRERLKALAGLHGPLQTNLAEVVSVDEEEMTCELKDEDDLAIYDVRLKPVLTEGESLVMIPKVGSMVLTARIEDDEEWTVIQCEEIEKFRVTVGEMVMELDGEKLQISKAGESLKSLLSDLLGAIKALTVPTNVGPSGTPINVVAFEAIENRINNFLK